ncbi:MAG: hypothetical protein COA50_04520 [Flavobacteriaceae bacterium]|nr:MAG: hypothetical protein COA50_04520 [Flavobacteriaceae bacterium]
MTMCSIQKTYFLFFIPLCILASVLFTSIYSYTVKQDLLHDFKGMKFIVDSDSDFEASLIYTYSQKFDGSSKLKNLKSTSDTLIFMFPDSDEIVKKFRLDFGNDPKITQVKIKQLQLLFSDKTIVLDEEDIFNGFYKNSSSIDLNKKQQIISFKKEINPFDPYIIFLPLAELSLQGPTYTMVLLSPFIIFLLVFLINIRKQYKVTTLEVLILLFIICIPLKIAWTTFCTILLCAYGLFSAINNKKLLFRNPFFYGFIGVFCLLVFFGRPSSFSIIDKQLSLLLFAFISTTIFFPKYKVYRYYVFTFFILNAIMLASSICFLFWFNDFYGLEIADYFINIKDYSDNIRGWLYYDHAAFLSFFGLVGLLFAHKLYERKEMDLKLVYSYHILLFLFIVLVGTRICLGLYVVFLVNLLTNWSNKKRILINTLLYVIFGSLLIFNIQKIDLNRYHLWNVSWEAIKDNPLFGYGLGKSNAILHNRYFIDKANFLSPLDLNHSHNQYITFLLEIGFVGLTVVIAGIAYFVYITKLYKNTVAVLFMFGLGYMFLTESILQTSKPLYVICFLFTFLTSKNKTGI